MPTADAPIGLERGRHHDLEGRGRERWGRHICVALMLAVAIVALAGFVGQRAESTTAEGQEATMTIRSSNIVRGGLAFTTEVDITAHSTINDLRILFAPGWFHNMTFNGLEPQPDDEASVAGGVQYSYGEVKAGDTFRAWLFWQTNPTNVGHRSQYVTLFDGDREIAHVDRSFTVLP